MTIPYKHTFITTATVTAMVALTLCIFLYVNNVMKCNFKQVSVCSKDDNQERNFGVLSL